MLSIHPPNLRYLSRLQEAQQRAESQNLGVWGLPAYRSETLLQLMKSHHQGWRRVIATPEAVKESRQFVRLILSPEADIRIPKQNLQYFPELENYLHHELEVRGWNTNIGWRCSVSIHLT